MKKFLLGAFLLSASTITWFIIAYVIFMSPEPQYGLAHATPTKDIAVIATTVLGGLSAYLLHLHMKSGK